MSTSGSKSNEHVAHFLVDIHTAATDKTLDLLEQEGVRQFFLFGSSRIFVG